MTRWTSGTRKILERMSEEMKEVASLVPFETFYSEVHHRLPPGVQSFSLGMRGPGIIRGLRELALRKCKKGVDPSLAYSLLPSDISDAHIGRGPWGLCWTNC